jgi:hypothetical protein
MAQHSTTIAFGEGNRGFQVGQSYGPINAEFHFPGELQWPGLDNANEKLDRQNDQKHLLSHHLQCLYVVTQTSSSAEHCSIKSTKSLPLQRPERRSSAWVALGERCRMRQFLPLTSVK